MSEKNRVLILGGTSEGRELAEYAEKKGISCLVSVVTQYGESLLKESGWVKVRQGPLNEEEMRRLLEEERPRLVLDATHPYAQVVSEQARRLCGELEIPLQRVLRPRTVTEGEGRSVFYVSSLQEAADWLEEKEGAVFLTTGSKELEVFASRQSLRKRLYARVLPDSQVVKACQDMGVSGAHLIAMQGPFSVEMNCALLRQTGAGWMVTKDSGSRGGFAEKLEAARLCGTCVLVVERPVEEKGISLKEAMALMGPGLAAGRSLFLVGVGMGGGAQLTQEAAGILESCDVVFGASRMLEAASGWISQARRIPVFEAEKILEVLEKDTGWSRAAVVVSGDTGFYSGASSLLQRLKQEAFPVRVLPGISSPAALAARLGRSWEDWYLASAHGRDCDLAALLREHPTVFLLLGGKGHSMGEICRQLKQEGLGRILVRGAIRMGYPDELLVSGYAQELCQVEDSGLACMLLEQKEEWS